jgi:hypothetical protein
MSKFTAFAIIVVLRIIFHPSNAQTAIAPFTSKTPTESLRRVSTGPASAIPIMPAKPIPLTRNNGDHNLVREWLVCEDHTQPFYFYEETSNEKVYLVSNRSINKVN